MIWPKNITACLKSLALNLFTAFGARVFIMAILLLPCIAVKPVWCAYRISLKNGSAFITQDYWRQNNLIRFYTRGGNVGIPQKAVAKIDLIDAETVDVNIITKNNAPVLASKTPLSKTPPAKLPQAPGKAAEAELTKEYSALENRFNNYRKTPNADLYKLARALTAYRNKILKLRLGHLHVKRLRAIYTMADEIETLLNERAQ